MNERTNTLLYKNIISHTLFLRTQDTIKGTCQERWPIGMDSKRERVCVCVRESQGKQCCEHD